MGCIRVEATNRAAQAVQVKARLFVHVVRHRDDGGGICRGDVCDLPSIGVGQHVCDGDLDSPRESALSVGRRVTKGDAAGTVPEQD